MSLNDDLIFKIVVCGDSNAGKTSILLNYFKNRSPHNLNSTIGVEYLSKSVTVDNSKIQLQIWDTAGQERYRSITKS